MKILSIRGKLRSKIQWDLDRHSPIIMLDDLELLKVI